MDIVVTIPRSEYENDDIENKLMQESEDTIQFWKFSKLPKNIQVGDRVYFIKNNKIPYSMRIREISKNDWEQCTTTGRIWEGNLIFMDDLREENLPFEVRGFRNFRYKWWED